MVSPAAKRISRPRLHLVALFLLLPLLAARHEDVVAATTSTSPAVSFSFNFSNISAARLEADLRFQGDATSPPANGLVSLTTSSVGGRGRMSYAHPVQLYDTPPAATRGDGMAFFLAYYPSPEPPKDSNGGDLGLIAGEGVTGQTIATGKDRFVAVEFDTFSRPYDPSYDHIGIDINTVREANYTKVLPSNTTLEGNMTAYISFNSSTYTDAGRLPVVP
ncbi:Os04g0123800 [Oryza sativa Japonica Group]|uniref:Os04g0123800 protein n=1 Tax=Oryza sativa subsp. japonica TaxID=39947 RepID=A0A0P0W6G5_ORYSJ|nr:Os04g0123800 [Oryza sativa Japonica Group]